VHRKVAALILYSVLLLVAGYLAGQSATTKAAVPSNVGGVQKPPAVAASTTGSEPLMTDWPDLTPD
jgi:hypothetical protein